jgi:cellobiose epimerase
MAKREISQSSLSALADLLDELLQKHIVAVWFPRSVDPAGGFHESMGTDWAILREPRRSTVYQSRMTWIAASLGRAGIDSPLDFCEISRDGARFLGRNLIDEQSGAVEWGVEPAGHWGTPHHLYSVSFAVFALAAVNSATGCARALDMAKRIFWRTDDFLYDHAHGGYFSVAQRLVLEKNRHRKDQIGIPQHLKSQNSLLHLMEAYTELARVWPSPDVLKRLAELIDIVKLRLFAPEGRLYEMTEADWTPASDVQTFGHDIEVSHLLIEAELTCRGEVSGDTWTRARMLLDHTVQFGWDARNDTIFSSSRDRESKTWWVQVEGLLGVISGLRIPGAPHDTYLELAQRLLTSIDRLFVDELFGGLHESVSAQGVPVRSNKAHSWKAAYHDGRAFLHGSRILRELSAAGT